MRALWTGSLSFGLVNIPVRLYSAVEEEEFDFRMLHKKDLSPIRYAKVCKIEGIEVTFEDVVKGYEYAKDEHVVMEEEDFERANVRKAKTVDIVDFVKKEEIDPNFYFKPYFLEPDKNAEKAYALLSEALKKSEKVGIARFVIRNREHLGAVRPSGTGIILNQMRFGSEIRSPAGLKAPEIKEAAVGTREVEMALALIEKLTAPFKPEAYKDTYAEELRRVIEEKAQGKTPRTKGKAPQPTRVHDLMEVLRASIEQSEKKVEVK